MAFGLMALAQVQLLFPLGRPLHRVGAQPVAALLLLVVYAVWRDGRSSATAQILRFPEASRDRHRLAA